MEREKGGIEEAMQDYLKEAVPADKECEVFGNGFAGFLSLLEKLKSEGRVGGVIPVEVPDPPVKAEDLSAIEKKFSEGAITGVNERSGNERLSNDILYIPVFEMREGKFGIKNHPWRINEEAGGIVKGIRMMTEALKYLHASPERPGKFPRVYEFLKSFALLFGDEARPAVNPARVDVFFSSVPMEFSGELERAVYGEAFRDAKTQTIITGLMGVKDVTEDGFKEWMTSFRPKKFQALWMDKLRTAVEEKRKEMSDRAVKQYMNRVLDRNPQGRGAILESAAPKKREAGGRREDDRPIIEITGEVRLKTSAGFTEPAGEKPAEEAVKVYRIIDVGEPATVTLDEARKTRAREIMTQLAYTMSGYGNGMKFGFTHFTTVCELIFGNDLPWIRPPRIDWLMLTNEGYTQPFKEMNKGKDEDLYFFSRLYAVRLELEKEGLRTQAVREIFIKELPLKTTKS